MAGDGNHPYAMSMTLMAGPVDTQINPTKVNDLAVGRPIEWFEQNLISTVPGAIRARAGRSIPASSSSPPS